MDKNSKICVIYGGMSAEREVSLKSGKNMADALLKNFPTLLPVPFSNTIVSSKNSNLHPVPVP